MPFVERSSEVNGRRIGYQEAGSGRPIIQLSGPGRPQVSPAHELLSQKYRVIVLDPTDSAVEPAQLIESVTALGLERFILWGLSSGADVALSLTLANPEAVDALILESPDITPEIEARLAEVETLTLALHGTDDPASQSGSKLKEKMKRCFFVLVYGAGKAISTDRPDAFADMVDDFLQRQERFIVSATPSVLRA